MWHEMNIYEVLKEKNISPAITKTVRIIINIFEKIFIILFSFNNIYNI